MEKGIEYRIGELCRSVRIDWVLFWRNHIFLNVTGRWVFSRYLNFLTGIKAHIMCRSDWIGDFRGDIRILGVAGFKIGPIGKGIIAKWRWVCNYPLFPPRPLKWKRSPPTNGPTFE